MRRFRNLILVLAAALWLPTTLHCALESLPGFQFLSCAENAESDSHCDDNCCSVERAQYKTQSTRVAPPEPDLTAQQIADTAAPDRELFAGFQVETFSAAPPEFPRRWQFVFRAASSPRAPSFAS